MGCAYIPGASLGDGQRWGGTVTLHKFIFMGISPPEESAAAQTEGALEK